MHIEKIRMIIFLKCHLVSILYKIICKLKRNTEMILRVGTFVVINYISIKIFSTFVMQKKLDNHNANTISVNILQNYYLIFKIPKR